jgi:biopolymer transport protein ExbB/biopolymer transport protein TolQ
MQFDMRTMAEHMGGVAWAVVIVLLIMSMYSIAVMIERYWTFKKATDQSRKFAPEAARLLKQGKIKEAIDAAHGPNVKYSHLAKVLGPGLHEWQYQRSRARSIVTKRPPSTPRSEPSSAPPPSTRRT